MYVWWFRSTPSWVSVSSATLGLSEQPKVDNNIRFPMIESKVPPRFLKLIVYKFSYSYPKVGFKAWINLLVRWLYCTVVQIENKTKKTQGYTWLCNKLRLTTTNLKKSIQYHLHQRWYSKNHHRFPTFENPFPLRAKTKVQPTSKLCHQQYLFKNPNG